MDIMRQMYTISEVALILRRSTKTIRRWEANGLLKSERTPSGRRLYKKIDIDLIFNFNEVKQNYMDLGIIRR